MGRNTTPPKVTRPRPFVQPAVRSALSKMTNEELVKTLTTATPAPMAASGGSIIREDLVPVLHEMFAKSFPAWSKITSTPSTAVKHSWHPPYGTPMESPAGDCGMAMGEGSVYCYDCDLIEPGAEWKPTIDAHA